MTVNAQTPLSSVEASKFRTLVKSASEKTKTITSDFTQYQHIEFMSNDIESSGRLAFKSPAMVRWEYVLPDPYIIVFKDEKLTTVQNGKKSSMDMGSNPVFKQLNQLITASITGDMFDDNAFEISYFRETGGYEAHLKPKDDGFAEFIANIQINFSSNGEVQEVKMSESSEDYTRIVFDNRKTNVPLNLELFEH
jgi:outer membrane lipoprotein carrier protein